jgi:hypothetical protein
MPLTDCFAQNRPPRTTFNETDKYTVLTKLDIKAVFMCVSFLPSE